MKYFYRHQLHKQNYNYHNWKWNISIIIFVFKQRENVRKLTKQTI